MKRLIMFGVAAVCLAIASAGIATAQTTEEKMQQQNAAGQEDNMKAMQLEQGIAKNQAEQKQIQSALQQNQSGSDPAKAAQQKKLEESLKQKQAEEQAMQAELAKQKAAP
jgi:tryptophanyl-tRNA synthetase